MVFIQVSPDYCLEDTPAEQLAKISEGLGLAVVKGDYLPELMLPAYKEDFISCLNRGFKGESFSVEIPFPCSKNLFKKCEVTVLPHYVTGQEIAKIGLGIRCMDQFFVDLALIQSNSLLSTMFNSVSMGICITNREGLFVEVNREYCSIYGYTREELLGKHFTLVLDSKYHEWMSRLHGEFFSKGQEPPSEVEVLHKTGKILTVRIFADKLTTPEGEEYKVTSVTDITELKNLEIQVQNLTRNIPGIVLRYELSPEGKDRILYVSEGVKTYCGVSQKEAMEDVSKIWDHIDPRHVSQVKESIIQSAKNLTTWESEWRFFHPDGSVYWHRASGNPRKLLDGTLIWDSIILDVTQEKEAQLKLQDSEIRFEKLISEGVEMIAVLNSNGEYVFNSPSYSSFLGYSLEELKGLQAFSLIHPDDVPQLYASFQQVFTVKKVYSQPYRFRKKDGEYIWLKSVGTNLLDDPHIGGIIVNSSNISELIKTETDLKSSEQQYKYLFENNPGAMLIWDLETAQILDVNECACEIYGYTREEFLNMSVYDMRPKEEVPKFKEQSKTENWVEYEGVRLYYGISRHIDKAGNPLDVEINAQMITYKGRRVSLVLMHDVTQQLKEELRLKLLESVITNANDAVIITEAEPFSSPGPRIIYVNEAFTRMTGYSEEEILGKNPRILHGPKTNSPEFAHLRKAMEAWQSCEVTVINYKKNGEEFWNNFSISPVADSKGWFTHWISIQRDVTAQKVEEQKRELVSQIMLIFGEEERFNLALDRSLEKLVQFKELDGAEVWLVNADRTKVNLVARFAQTDKGKRFMEISSHIQSFKPGEGLPGKIWEANRNLQIDESCSEEEFPRKELVLSSGLSTAFGLPLHYSQEVIGVIVFATDQKNGAVNSAVEVFEPMTDMLGAEIHRKKVQDELSQIFDTAQDIICIWGFDGKFKKINKGGTQLLGYSEEELLANRIDYFLHPEDHQSSESELQKMREGNRQAQFINRFITKEGQTLWLDWNNTVVYEEELIYSVAKNITEEKELEDLLERANKMARIGFWDVDVMKKTQYWSAVTKEIHEVSPDFTPTVEEGIQFYAPEAVQTITEIFNQCQKFGTPYDLELPIITAKGRKIWIRTQGQAEFRDGICKRVFGTIQDITDLKIAQLELKKSYEQKNAILESIGDAFLSVDKMGTITYWNQVAAQLFGGTKEERVGSSVWSLIPLTKENITVGKLREAIALGKVLHYEQYFQYLGKWLEISIYPSEIGLSVYLKDVTIRKTSEELIRQSNERFERVSEVTADAIWDWDVRADKLYWGSGFRQLFGITCDPKDITYHTWERRVHPDDLEKTLEVVENAIRDVHNTNIYNEYRFRREDGTYAFVTDRGMIIRDPMGSPLRLVGAISDITERKMYENSLRELNEKLEARARELAISNAELEQFAYVASHDLQEPLRMVSSFLSQLEIKYKNQLDEKANRYIHFAVDGAKRMRQIILDLLEFSRVGRMNDEVGEVSIQSVLEEVCTLQAELIESKQAAVFWGEMPVVLGSKTPLFQIFQNLISNAVKYSKEGVPPEVKISSIEFPTYWEFKVQDNGIGIEADSLDKIFVIFQRLHTKDQYAGTGIGLAIVKKLVENLGGKISVESTPGVGTVFSFTLRK